MPAKDTGDCMDVTGSTDASHQGRHPEGRFVPDEPRCMVAGCHRRLAETSAPIVTLAQEGAVVVAERERRAGL